ncbi:hypothetical protein YSY43_03060 [Paenibacillus sp. YSY-4.3]
MNLTMGLIQVQLDKEGYLLVCHEGETDRFVEIEPGVLSLWDTRRNQ